MDILVKKDIKGYLYRITMDILRITQKDIVRGYLCRISLGYLKDISGYPSDNWFGY